MANANYQLEQKTFLLSDGSLLGLGFINDRDNEYIDRLNYHVKADDYFGTMAAILNIIMAEADLSEPHYRIIRRLFSDFIYLQNNYKIVRRKKKKLKF